MTPAEALEFFAQKQKAFRAAFAMPPHGPAVLDDLVPYCHEQRTTFHTDHAIASALEGRRQVMLRIREFLDLTPEQLVALNTKAIDGAPK